MKRYMLDTNCLLNNLGKLNEYEGLTVCLAVVDELDKIKERSSNEELKFKARKASRWLRDNKVEFIDNDYTYVGTKYTVYECIDRIIVSTAKHNNLILLTNDLNTQHRCKCMNVEWELCEYEFKEYTGHREIMVNSSVIQDVYDNGSIDSIWEFNQNECVTLIDVANEKNQAMTFYKNNKLRLVKANSIYGVKGKNRQQKYAMDLLKNANIPIVLLNASLGTGKSFLSMLAGLDGVEKGLYDSILYIKPLEAMGGKDIGFLPDSKEEKLLGGYSGTIINILDNICKAKNSILNGDEMVRKLIRSGELEVEAMTFMRGMSYYRKFVIVDEASNLSKDNAINLIGRLGEGSKMCFIGSSEQIDNPKLNKYNNGLTFVQNRLKGEDLFGTVKLDRVVRSKLAEMVVNKLQD